MSFEVTVSETFRNIPSAPSLHSSTKLPLQQMALAALIHSPGVALFYFFLKNKGDFFFPSAPPGATAHSPANQESVIELVPGPVAAASAKRQTDPAQRLGECEVRPSLELLACISLLPSSQRHLRRKKAPACQALNRPACTECKRGGCTSLPSPAL